MGAGRSSQQVGFGVNCLVNLNFHTITGGLVWVCPKKSPDLLLWGSLSGFWHLEEQNFGEEKEQLNPVTQNAYFYLMPFLSPSFQALLVLAVGAWGVQSSYFTLSRVLWLTDVGQGEKTPCFYLWRVKAETWGSSLLLNKLPNSAWVCRVISYFCPPGTQCFQTWASLGFAKANNSRYLLCRFFRLWQSWGS